MTKARHHIKRGVFWIGSANLITRLLDFGSIVVVLWFLTKEEMGVATLAWTVAAFLEAFNGLGIGTAILQAKTIERRQLDSAWWYVMGIATGLFVTISLCASLIADFFDTPELPLMIIVSSSKLLFVGAALIPIQTLNRQLRFKEIGAVQTLATLLASILKIALAALGFGAWALVISFTAAGAFALVSVYLFQPFWPRFHFVFSEIRHLVVFGIKVAVSAIIYHFYRNADYLVVGRVLGKEALGVYRVAFDVAMTPPLTIMTVVNRAALPVFSKLSEQKERLIETFLWTQKNLALLVMPVAIFLFFSSEDLMHLIGKSQWVGAAGAIKVLCWAAVLRSLDQVFPQLFHARGRPDLAIYDSLAAVVVLVGMFAGYISLFAETYGIVSVALAWLSSYPILIFLLLLFTRWVVPLRMTRYLANFRHPILVSAIAVFLNWLGAYLNSYLPENHWTLPLISLVLTCSVFFLYLRFVMGVRLRDVLGSTAKSSSSR
jgi:O-antigen/teichoic acid export membrane protein